MNTQVSASNLTSLAMFSISDVRNFFAEPKVWGKESKVYMDDELIHVRDEGVVTTYTNDEATQSAFENAKPLTDNFLQEHSDKASVYIETGIVQAKDEKSCTKYVRNVMLDNSYQDQKWSDSLEDILRAWICEDYRDLKLD